MSKAESDEAFRIGDVEVAPGERKYFEIPLAKLPTGSQLALPVCALNGIRPGPSIWLSAAVHGDEINGVDIIRRVLEKLQPRDLAGRLLAVPIVNVFGFINQSRYLPDRRDLNRSFPGSRRGSLAARIAHLFMAEIVDRCAFGIDLHTGSNFRTNLPQIRADLADSETRRLARAFRAPVLVASAPRHGTMREAAQNRGVRILLYEGGEAQNFNRTPIRVGVTGVLNVLHALDMIAPPEPPAPVEVFEGAGSEWARAGRGGILHLDVRLGEAVAEGQVLGAISDTFGRSPGRVRSPVSGVVIGHTTNPLVNRGDAVVHVAYRER